MAQQESDFTPQDGLRFGERLHVTRRRAGMTLRALEEATGIPNSTLSRYELGPSEPPVRHVIRLALALGTTPDALLGFGPTRMLFNPSAVPPEFPPPASPAPIPHDLPETLAA
jgi:transcriptional regulator with XRE-family HTH domain